jgi:hypothetical protein
MELPPELKSEIQALFDHAKEESPERLSKDGRALHIYGTIGSECYISPEGDIYMETYDIMGEEPPAEDRSRSAQLVCLILGSEHIPALAQALPTRPPDVPLCETCAGVGWLHPGKFGPRGLMCHECYGLGWIEVS